MILLAALALVAGGVAGGGSVGAVATGTSAVQGQVFGWMDPLGEATVTVFDAASGSVLRSVNADIDGHYRIDGLPSVPVKVRATKTGWLTTWANGAATKASATIFTLLPGQTLTYSQDPPVLYLDLTPEAVVTGSVLGISDDPSGNWDDPLAGVTVTAFNASTGQALRSATTDGLGKYRIGMLNPTIAVKIRAVKTGWLTTWADGKTTKATADVFPLAPYQPIPIPEIVIYGEAAIQGQVLGSMDPLGGATVTVFDADSGAALRTTTSDAAGNYRVGGLPAGHIKVRATKSGWLTSWANGRTSQATADVFTLHSGQTLTQSWDPVTLYLDLARPATVTGTVFGHSQTVDGPIAGAKVRATDAVTGACLGSAITDSAGRYQIGGLRAGQFNLRATLAGFLPATNGPIPIQEGQSLELGENLHLNAEAAIEGDVLGEMDPLPGARVTVFNAQTGAAIRSVTADGGGHYRIGMLPAGPIKVRATLTGWQAGWANGRTSEDTADIFTLLSGQTLLQSWDPMVLYLDLRRVSPTS